MTHTHGEHGDILPSARVQSARRLFGYVVSINPSDALRESLKFEEGLPVADRLRGYFDNIFATRPPYQTERGELAPPTGLIYSGVDDIDKIVAEHTRGKQAREILEIVQSEATVRSLAYLAFRSQHDLADLLKSGNPLVLSEDGVGLAVGKQVPPGSNGCPFVELDDSEQVMPSPLFSRFVRWTAQLLADEYRRTEGA
ncbi:MAG TPA: hypothetical protein VGE34_03505 [Candidatus Saccharimonadales bacterium]